MKKISGMFVKLALLGSVLLQSMYSSDLSVWLNKVLPFHPKKKNNANHLFVWEIVFKWKKLTRLSVFYWNTFQPQHAW